jgi:SAM-dependent methyltransferase
MILGCYYHTRNRLHRASEVVYMHLKCRGLTVDKTDHGRHMMRSLKFKFTSSMEEFMATGLARAFIVFTLLVGGGDTAFAQETIPFVPSPEYVVQRMLELAKISKGDVLYDMGSGDGRIVIEAAKRFGVRGVGIDLNPDLVAKARENAAKEGVSQLVEFRAQDGLTVDISEATVVTLYMFKWFNNALKPKLQKLKPGSRVVAHDFDIDDWKPSRIEYVSPPKDGTSQDYAESRTLYLWIVGDNAAMP